MNSGRGEATSLATPTWAEERGARGRGMLASVPPLPARSSELNDRTLAGSFAGSDAGGGPMLEDGGGPMWQPAWGRRQTGDGGAAGQGGRHSDVSRGGRLGKRGARASGRRRGRWLACTHRRFFSCCFVGFFFQGRSFRQNFMPNDVKYEPLRHVSKCGIHMS